MSFFGDQYEQTLRRIQLEVEANVTKQIAVLENKIKTVQGTIAVSPAGARPSMNNMTRNGDHRHSVDSWWNEVAGDGAALDECANVYIYPPLDVIVVNDAAINMGTNVVNCVTSNPFTAAMNGRYMIIEGAGADDAPLSGIITYVSPSQATLSENAATTVEAARARMSCQKLAHKNTKNTPGDTINDALKDAAHASFATNIQDPRWRRLSGDVAIGSRNVLGYPFGYFADDGTTYVPLHQLWAGRVVFARFNLARANRFVKVKGRLFVAIYNNNPRVLDWVKGSKFELSAAVLGSPATTTAAEYMVVIETGSGFSIVSDILTIENAPDVNAFNNGAKVKLNWTRFAGAINTIIYRRLDGENVFRLEAVTSIENEYTDGNNPTRQETGASFPIPENAQDTIASYFATPEGGLDLLPNNELGESFQPIEIFLPFPPSVNMAELLDPHFIVGLTEPLATEVQDAALDGAGNIESASGAFTLAMVGKNFTIRHQETNQTASGTILSYTSPTEIQLDPAPAFTTTGCILEIEDSQPGGILFDLVGTALTETSSDWDFHPDDNNRQQQSASNPPEGSTQGGISGGDGYGGGTGVIYCVLDEVLISVRGDSNTHIIQKRASALFLTDLVWNGQGYRDDDFNEIDWIKHAKVKEITRLITETRELPCTKWHRVVPSEAAKQSGVAVSALMKGNKTLHIGRKSSKLETILDLRTEYGDFAVVSLGLKGKNPRTRHLLVTNDLLSHNRKSYEYEQALLES